MARAKFSHMEKVAKEPALVLEKTAYSAGMQGHIKMLYSYLALAPP